MIFKKYFRTYALYAKNGTVIAIYPSTVGEYADALEWALAYMSSWTDSERRQLYIEV